MSNETAFPLSEIPDGARAQDVEAQVCEAGDRKALRLVLSERARTGVFGIDHVDEPTFLLLPQPFKNGTIEVDVMGRLLADAPDFARGFIGLAWRVRPEATGYESVYLRPTNGLKVNPPAPRDQRAVQYYAYPDWKFDRLRSEEPDGGFEAGADIGPDDWYRLRVEVDGTRLRAFVDGAQVLDLARTKGEETLGDVALWVDIGTEGFFSNLLIRREAV